MENSKLQHLLGQHTLIELAQFISECLDPPATRHNIFFTVKTSDKLLISVWGKDESWIIEQFLRFLDLRFYS